MDDPAAQLREALEAFRHEEAMERARRWRGIDGAESERAVARRHRRLGDVTQVRALLEDVTRAGVDSAGAAALRAHLARAAADLVLAPARDALEAAGGVELRFGRDKGNVDDALVALSASDPERQTFAAAALEAHASRVGEHLAQAKGEADREGLRVFAGGARPPDAGPEAQALAELAESLLAATDDVAHEVRGWLAPTGSSVFELMPRLALPEASSFVPRRDRYRRLSEGVAALGFEGDLASRVRVAGTHPFPGPRARVVLARTPTDARLFESRREWGVASELSGAAVLGRALAHVLAAPALPLEHRRPLGATVARAFGVIVAQLIGDRVHLIRRRGMTAADADRLGRAAGALGVLTARLRAAAVTARAASRSPAELEEQAAAAASRALGADVPIALARLAVVTPAAAGPRFRATLHGLGLAWQLRERFDEDWFDNPKAAEPLRAAAARGGLLSVEDFAAELGATPELAPRRLAELFG